MAGAFSGHLIDSFHPQQGRSSSPFGVQSPKLITSGPMSFNPQMHGTPAMGNQSMGDFSFSFGSPQPSFFKPELSEATTLKIASLQAKLNQKLGPEYISQRPGPGGGPKLTYAEGWKIINLANEVFGFNGWSSSVVSLTTDFMDYNEESRRYNVGTTAIMRVTLRDGVFHEDIGYGMVENAKGKGAALDKCKKEAVTDGLKRALRNFGNLLGNCLYDKSYTQEVIKIKVPPPKFEKSELHRRPEFDETKPNINTSMSTSTSTPSFTTHSTSSNHNVTPTRPPANVPQQQPKVLSSLPLHMRSEAGASSHRPSTDNQPTASTSKPQPPNQSTSTSAVTSNPAQTRSTAHSAASMPPPPQGVKPTASTAITTNLSPPQPNNKIEIEDPDESFHFNSDDDAFLALVDLGEGDLGPPVHPETDLGRPLYEDEGDSISQPEERARTSFGSGVAGQEQGLQQPGPAPRQPSSSTRAHAPGTGIPPQQGTGMLSKLLPHNQPQAPQQQQPQSHGHRQQPKHLSANQNQNQNHIQNNQKPNPYARPNQTLNHPSTSAASHAPQSSTSTSSTAAPKRPTTPSMGGFHFPPGVDPRPDNKGQGQGQASGIGVKRPLDSLSSSGNARPTMGLGSGGQGQVKREVFGRLDVGEGGDVKRPRR